MSYTFADMYLTLNFSLLPFIIANFPWLEPLLLWLLKRDPLISSVFLMYETALALVQDRMKSQQSPKVAIRKPSMMTLHLVYMP